MMTQAPSEFRRKGWSVPGRYKLTAFVGSGANGQVALAMDNETKKKVAIKRVELENGLVVAREVRLLRELRGHANLLQLQTVLPPTTPDFKEIYIVTEALDADMTKLFEQPEQLIGHHLLWFSYKLLQAVAVLAAKGIVHRDIKPSNIFLTESCNLSLGDFGLARALSDTSPLGQPLRKSGGDTGRPQTQHVCTRYWRGPEVLLMTSYSSVSPSRSSGTAGRTPRASDAPPEEEPTPVAKPPKYGPPLDMWSVGCVVFELFGMLVPLAERKGTLFPGDYSTLSPPGEGGRPMAAHNIRHDQLGMIIRVLGAPCPGKPVDAKNNWAAVADEVAVYNPVAARFIRLASGKERTEEEQQTFWKKRLPGVSDELRGLFLSMVCFRPEERITAAEALRHPCFDSVRSPRDAEELARATVVEDFGDVSDLRALLCAEIAALNPGWSFESK